MTKPCMPGANPTERPHIMAKKVDLTKRSHYPIMVLTSKPSTTGNGQTQRRTRFHSADAASEAVKARIDSGITVEFTAYATDPK